MGTFQQHFEIERPLHAVAEAFSQPEALLRNLPGVTSVTRAGEDLYRVAFGTREVEIVLVRFPPHRIEWRTTDARSRGAVELQALAPGRTAVAMTADTSGDQTAPSAAQLHEGLHALKRALQSTDTAAGSGFMGSHAAQEGRRFASEWRDTARSAFSRPTDFPFTLMRTITRQVDRVWSEVMRAAPMSRLPQMVPGMQWNSGVEVREQDGEVRVCVDVPGVEESQLDVRVDDGYLTVRGERHAEDSGDAAQRRSTLHYGSFTRRIPLPDGVDPDSAKAVLKNGVLEIRLALHRRTPRRVPVNSSPQ